MLRNNQELRFELPSVTKIVLMITVAVYLLQLVSGAFLPFDITSMMILNRDAVAHLQLWRFVTYIFLHGGLFHIFINMFMLVMFGREMEQVLGSRRFLSLYLISGILGGLGWLVISGNGGGNCLGASGAVLGILGAFAAIFPSRKITLLVFFVLPVTMTARTLVLGLGVISIFSMMGTEGGNIAHAAHLFGGVAGYLYGRKLRLVSGGWKRPERRVDSRWRRKNLRLVPNDSFNEAPSEGEVNNLLDKITDKGLGSLSKQERKTLENASEKKRN